MTFLVELDHVKPGSASTPETGQTFIREVILPTLARAEELLAAKRIVAGGPVVGRIALRFIVEADSLQEVDRIISSLPLWPLSESRVSPLISFAGRREQVQTLFKDLQNRHSEEPRSQK